MSTRTISLICLSLAATAMAHAEIVTTVAVGNATVQPGGVRGGSNGLRFFNVEGNSFGTFASYGVVDFSVSGLGLASTVADVPRLTLKLYAALAAFSAEGPVDVFLTNDTSTSIAQGGASPLVFDSTSLPNGIGAQLETKWKLGSLDFIIGLSGDESRFDASTLPSGARSYLLQQLNGGSGLLRFILAPGLDSTAATWAGYTNTTYTIPTIELEVAYGTVPSVAGKLTFGDRLDRYPSSVDVDFLDPADPSQVKHTAHNVGVDAQGGYSTTDLPAVAGQYIVSVKVGSWLRKNGAQIDSSLGASGVDLALTNGDIDGDNAVTVFDYNALSDAFDSSAGDASWNEAADLDGDGSVTVFDYNILSANFDLVGD